VIRIVILSVFCFIAAFAIAKIPDSADGVTQKACAYEPGQQCTIDAARWSKRKFNHNRMGRVDGVTGKQLWSHPKTAKRVWVHKFEVYLKNHPNYASKRSSSHSTDLCFYQPDPEACRAKRMYSEALQNTTCAHAAKYQPYTVNKLVCDDSWTSHINTQQVKRYGTVIVCGGALAVAVATAPETGGGSLVAAAGAGSVSCFWGFMIGSS
jgi:hypothetical protein